MIIARFKHPTNMGSEAREVRLFVLLVIPTKEKVTKDSLETGRTFATMLADPSFKYNLLNAHDEIEFRATMVVRAQQLSGRYTLKNRVKYSYDPALHMAISGSLMSKSNSQGSSNRSTPSAHARDPNNNTGSLSSNSCHFGYNLNLFEKNPHTSRLFEVLESSISENDERTHKQGAESELKQGNPVASKLGQYYEAKSPMDGRHVEYSQKRSLLATCCNQLEFGRGFWSDFKRRLRYYPSDYKDAFIGPPRTVQKTVATIWFLYFGILLPTIAFSSLNLHQTHGHMGDLRKAIIGQVIGGLGFAVLGGQPLVIIMTTAPLCLYTKGELARLLSALLLRLIRD